MSVSGELYNILSVNCILSQMRVLNAYCTYISLESVKLSLLLGCFQNFIVILKLDIGYVTICNMLTRILYFQQDLMNTNW